jgi:FtsH-binding integral membrane protein
MSFARAVQIWKITSLALAGIYVVAAIAGIMAEFERTRDTVLWVSFLGVGALLILLGHRKSHTSPPLAALLVSLGAAAGALPLFWSVLVPLACAVVIALSVAIARQASSAPA